MFTHTVEPKTKKDIFVLSECPEVYKPLDDVPAGNYRLILVGHPMNPDMALKEQEGGDKMIKLKAEAIDTSMNAIAEFLSPETAERFALMGMTHKMGMILYGPPGTGKTSIAAMLMDMAAKKYGAIAINVTGHGLGHAMHVAEYIRKAQNTPIILFMDEVEGCLSDPGSKDLTWLDGDKSVPGVIFLGCTNHINQIDKRISMRSGRIRHLIKVSKMPYEVFLQYATEKVRDIKPERAKELAWAASEKGLTIDDFKALLIDVVIYGKTVDLTTLKPAKFNEVGVSLEDLLNDDDNN